MSNLKNWIKKHDITLYQISRDLKISQSLISEVFSGKKYLSPLLALKIEEYTRQIDPEDYIKAVELINPKKLKEFEIISKLRR